MQQEEPCQNEEEEKEEVARTLQARQFSSGELYGSSTQPQVPTCKVRSINFNILFNNFFSTDLLMPSLGPLPPSLVVDVISRDPELTSPPPNHPTHQNLQLRLPLYKEIWKVETKREAVKKHLG